VILVGVTGGIAAYKTCGLIRLLVRAGYGVYPLVTAGAERFVRAETFFALAQRSPAQDPYPHLQRAELLVIAPLTANTLAKLAHGLADDLLTEAALAHAGPILVAPAMNSRMWEHPATRANVELLRSRGVEFVGPEEGDLAEGEEGIGRMAEPREIFRRCNELLFPDDELPLRGKKIVVTAGGTREAIDAVRFIGNRSSGRMGAALAWVASQRGADVTLIAANLNVDVPPGVSSVNVRTAKELERHIQIVPDADVVIMAAAVADYRPVESRGDKRRKDGANWELTLEPTDDILAKLGAARQNGQVLVGFAAETGEDGLTRARAKRTAKNVDLMVYNDVADPGIGFESLDNEVVLISELGERHVDRAPKRVIAQEILDEVERLLETNGG
jgi:phosphopantothenoylcysteine decarboxylase/phosphopantothenate--cysteine ligase